MEKEIYQKWLNVLKNNPHKPYEQSETFNEYWLRKWNHYDALARNFLRNFNEKSF